MSAFVKDAEGVEVFMKFSVEGLRMTAIYHHSGRLDATCASSSG
jgi:hypothetical protein